MLRRALSAPLRRFAKGEDGSMIIFGMFLFFLILIVAGMATDMMRFESTRSKLQGTLDRAVLAAADLDQTRDPTTVVQDYFRSAGILSQLKTVTVTSNFNSRQVAATADLDLSTYFMRLAGVSHLDAPASGTAAEAVNDIEVVLVLDISGSMVQNGSPKLANLKSAASEFVQTVLQNDSQSRISIAIVPFNGQVNLGSVLAAKYNITDVVGTSANYGTAYNYVNCVDLPASVYSTQTISRTLAMPATALADTWDYASGVTDSNGDRVVDSVPNSFTSPTLTANLPLGSNMWCPPTDSSGTSTAGNIVRLPSHSITTLQNQINGLVGVGATSINAGMRWGMTLLDPGARPMFNELISAGQIPSSFSGRPYDFNRQNTLKVIVLMTDGENFPEERVNTDTTTAGPGFRTGASPIWKATDGNYSIYHPAKVTRTSSTTICNSRPFWVPHLAQWHVRPWNGSSTGATSGCYSDTATYTSVTRQTWPQVWTALRMSWVDQQFYARAGVLSTGIPAGSPSVLQNYRTQIDLFRSRTDTATGNTPIMDGQMDSMCSRAKTSGIVIYGIAFEAPQHGQDSIFACASSPSHYYNAQGLQISTAFRAIAAQINALKLVN